MQKLQKSQRSFVIEVGTAVAILILALSTYATAKGLVLGKDVFEVTYEYRIPALRKGDKFAAWIPLASSDDFQTIERKIESLGLVTNEGKDPDFANSLLHIEADSDASDKSIKIIYKVIRLEKGAHSIATGTNKDFFLRSEPLVPLTDRFKKIAAEVIKGKHGTLSKGRAIYDYVLQEMKYDKSGNGWGRGDAVYACDAKTGNCTDFHALFIALARSASIPARFAIGFTIPPQGRAGAIEGYHCWAEFLADNQWIPVDISEASKEPQFKDYYFGHHPANRLQISEGRQLTMVPAAASGPVNFFVHPFVEINGKPVKATVGSYSFKRASDPVTKM